MTCRKNSRAVWLFAPFALAVTGCKLELDDAASTHRAPAVATAVRRVALPTPALPPPEATPAPPAADAAIQVMPHGDVPRPLGMYRRRRAQTGRESSAQTAPAAPDEQPSDEREPFFAGPSPRTANAPLPPQVAPGTSELDDSLETLEEEDGDESDDE